MRTLSTDHSSAGKGPNPRKRRRTRRKGSVQETVAAGLTANMAGDALEKHVQDAGQSVYMKEDGSGQTSDLSCAEENKIGQRDCVPARIRRNTRRPGRKAPVTKPFESPKPSSSAKTSQESISVPSVKSQQQKLHSNLYAALDLGTNNCRLLIATPQYSGRFRVVDGFSRIVRLGEGLAQTGRLSQEAMDRAVEALSACAKKLESRNIKKQRLIATEACRQAANGEVFLSRVQKETGLELEVVSRETEAQLAAAGCGTLIDKKAEGAVLFDIGGGSSELILVSCKDKKPPHSGYRILDWTSLPMGVVTLAEQFGGRNVTRALFEEMEAEVLAHISQFEGRNALADIFSDKKVHLLGTSGTVTTLAGIYLKLEKYDRRRVDGLWLNSKQMDMVIDELIDMSYEERMLNPCIGSERADLVLAGCAILNAIRKTWPANRLRVADRGLREGLLTQMMREDKKWLRNASGNRKRRRRSNNHKKRGEVKS